MTEATTDEKDEFTAFFDNAERRLRLSLVGAFGLEAGGEAAAEALTWAWQNWGQVRTMKNPIGYLYRVGRTAGLRSVNSEISSATVESAASPARWETQNYEPKLASYLAELSETQRVAVWMIHGLGFSHGEVAELLECSKPTVATHVRRGLLKLRRGLGVSDV